MKRFRFPGLLIALCSLPLATFWSCSTDMPTSSDGSGGRSAPAIVPVGQPQDVVYPIPPLVDFCGGTGVGTILAIETDADAGFAYSSSVAVPASGGRFNIYFANLGPGPITFVSTGAFSVNGVQVPRGAETVIPFTPTGSSAAFQDGFFGGTFNQGTAYLGCVIIDDIAFKSAKHSHATAHLDMSFLRDGVLHTVRVNVHTSSRIS